jgi:hypothetical protein
MLKSISQLIVTIPNWQTKSPETLFEELSICEIPYVDSRDWTLQQNRSFKLCRYQQRANGKSELRETTTMVVLFESGLPVLTIASKTTLIPTCKWESKGGEFLLRNRKYS